MVTEFKRVLDLYKEVEMNPLLSIVIPSFNQRQFIADCFDSIPAALREAGLVEVIVVDGGSTDGAADIIRTRSSEFSYSVSERDRGQSDALNKGMAVAKGNYLTWLNSDDVILDGALEEVISIIQRGQAPEWLAGNVALMDQSGIIRKVSYGPDWSEMGTRLGYLNVFGPSTFFARRLWDKCGPFDMDMHYSMDTALWWKFCDAENKFSRLRRVTWGLRAHEAAKTSQIFAGVGMSSKMKVELESMMSRIAQGKPMRRFGQWRAPVTMVRCLSGLYLKSYASSRRAQGRHFKEVAWGQL